MGSETAFRARDALHARVHCDSCPQRPSHGLELCLDHMVRIPTGQDPHVQRDASVLGEVVTPRDFNTLRRIADEDNDVIDEQESFLELASSEALFADLQRVLATEASRWLTDLDDGIHSGLQRQSARGVFFYFRSPHPDGGTPPLLALL